MVRGRLRVREVAIDEHRVARLVSFWPAVTWNWLLNRGLTFGERPRQPRAPQWAKFVTSSLLGLGINVGSYPLLTSLVDWFARNRLLALLGGVALGGLANFVVSNLYVYRSHAAAQSMDPGSGDQSAGA